MTKLRIGVGAVLLAIGLASFIFELIHRQWLSGLTCLVLGGAVAWATVLGLDDSRDSIFLRIAAPAAMLLGIFAVFSENPAFDFGTVKAHVDAYHAFANLQQYCQPMNEQLQMLQAEGVKACATQDNRNQAGALVDLQKAKDFPPVLALADGAWSVLSRAHSEDACLEVRDLAKKQCPEAFSTVERH